MTSSEVVFFLLPMPMGRGAVTPAIPGRPASTPASSSTAAATPAAVDGKGQGKAAKLKKRKLADGNGARKATWPSELVAYQAKSDGTRFCYNFNMAGCSLAVNNGSCAKGLRKCLVVGRTVSALATIDSLARW